MQASEQNSETPRKQLVMRLMGYAAAGLIVLAGVALRAIHFFNDRDLWLDEAMLALNIANRGFLGLLQPLDLNQAAPIGFLYLEKLATLALGNNEVAMRLFPFIASLATLPLFLLLARSILGFRGALFALLILALSPTAVEYAAEAKQYAFDLLASIIVLMAVDFYLRDHASRASRIVLVAAGSLTLLFSHGVIFVTASAGVALLVREAYLKRWNSLRDLTICGAIVLGAGALDYIVHLRHVAENAHFAEYWRNSLTWARPFSVRGMEHIRDAWVELFELPLGLHTYRLGSLVFLGGLVAFAFWRRGVWAAIGAMPILLVTTAAMLDRYPFSDRLLLFLVPVLALGVAAGIEALIRVRKGRLYVLGWILAWLILGETVRHVHEEWDFLHSRRSRTIEPVLAHMLDRMQPGDVVYVDGLAMPVYRFYTEARPEYASLLQYKTVFGAHQGENLGTDEEKFAQFGSPPRVWALFQYFKGEHRAMADLLQTKGHQVDLAHGRETRAFLFELAP